MPLGPARPLSSCVTQQDAYSWSVNPPAKPGIWKACCSEGSLSKGGPIRTVPEDVQQQRVRPWERGDGPRGPSGRLLQESWQEGAMPRAGVDTAWMA